MVSNNSTLRNLPVALDRKQALFLDGIRHSAEMVEVAYSRLKVTLTSLAKADGHPMGSEFTEAFLDAWSVIDAADRFRALWKLQPFAENLPQNHLQQPIDQEFKSVRDLRNLSDHLAQRADYVLSKNGTALGCLKWITVLDNGDFQGCILVPGTFRPTTVNFAYPAGRTVELPTGFIDLSAGEYSVVLDDVIASIQAHVSAIEILLDRELDRHGLRDRSAGADLLFKAKINFGNNFVRNPIVQN